MIATLHRGVWPNDYSVTWGGGVPPKNDYVICAQPHINLSAFRTLVGACGGHSKNKKAQL